MGPARSPSAATGRGARGGDRRGPDRARRVRVGHPDPTGAERSRRLSTRGRGRDPARSSSPAPLQACATTAAGSATSRSRTPSSRTSPPPRQPADRRARLVQRRHRVAHRGTSTVREFLHFLRRRLDPKRRRAHRRCRPSTKYVSYEIDVRIVSTGASTPSARGDAGTRPSVRRNLPELTMLPGRKTPAVDLHGGQRRRQEGDAADLLQRQVGVRRRPLRDRLGEPASCWRWSRGCRRPSSTAAVTAPSGSSC